MSTITRERVAQYANDTRMCNVNDEIRQIARIALASLEAEPVAWLWSNRKHPSEVTLVRPEDDDKAEAAQWSGWTYKALYAVPPALASVPDERYKQLSELYHAQEKRLFKLAQRIKGQSFDKYSHSPSQAIDVLEWALFGESEDACRAAMLQGAEPVTTAYKLPFEQWLSQQTGTIDVECGCVMTEVFFHWLRVAYEAGNSPHFREIVNSSTNNFRENSETSTKCPCCGRKPLKNKTCSVAGCNGKHVARGFCVKHYAIERKKEPSRRDSIRAADKRYRARKAAAPQQEVIQALAKGMERYGDAMQELSKKKVK